jgi:mannose-6-phosphate isomerase-like protein (cupin superfamily)
MPSPFATMSLPAVPDTLAPDGSEIRLLPAVAGGSMVHARLPPDGCSRAVRHRTVEELWYVVAGTGELWRARDGRAEMTALRPGIAVSIPLGTSFQFRCTGAAPLEIVIVTMPPWPGPEEAVRVTDHWPLTPAP